MEEVRLSPSERLTRWREQHPTPPRHKPTSRELTAAELAELDRAGLSWAERLTRARQMQQQPPPQPESPAEGH